MRIEDMYWDLDENGDPVRFKLDENGEFLPGEHDRMTELLAGSRFDERRVALDEVGKVRVSTVFLCLAHYSPTHGFDLYETLVEGPGGDAMYRYKDKKSALEGHEKIVMGLVEDGLGDRVKKR